MPLTVPVKVLVAEPQLRMTPPEDPMIRLWAKVALTFSSTRPPPLRVTVLEASPKLELMLTTPEVIVTPPVKVLTPESSRLPPTPPPVAEVSPWAARVRPPEPLMMDPSNEQSYYFRWITVVSTLSQGRE